MREEFVDIVYDLLSGTRIVPQKTMVTTAAMAQMLMRRNTWRSLAISRVSYKSYPAGSAGYARGLSFVIYNDPFTASAIAAASTTPV